MVCCKLHSISALGLAIQLSLFIFYLPSFYWLLVYSIQAGSICSFLLWDQAHDPAFLCLVSTFNTDKETASLWCANPSTKSFRAQIQNRTVDYLANVPSTLPSSLPKHLGATKVFLLHRALDDLSGLLLGQKIEVNRMNISTWAAAFPKDALEKSDAEADSRLLRK